MHTRSNYGHEQLIYFYFCLEHYNFVGEDDLNNIVAVSVVGRRDSITDFKALVRTEQVPFTPNKC